MVNTWLITMVNTSPKDWVVGPLPNGAIHGFINGGYQPLTNWNDPLSTKPLCATLRFLFWSLHIFKSSYYTPEHGA